MARSSTPTSQRKCSLYREHRETCRIRYVAQIRLGPDSAFAFDYASGNLNLTPWPGLSRLEASTTAVERTSSQRA